MEGGINTSDPALVLPPGELIDTRNYECALVTGYKRIQGYERYDGQQSPADESYWLLNFTAGDVEPSAEDLVTGGTSGHTGIYQTAVITSGSWAGNDAVGYIIVRSASGVFSDTETLTTSGGTLGTANGTASQRGAATDALDNTYLQAAMEAARSDIAAVPGSGIVRGVWQFGGVTYAFRDNAGATAGAMYKSTSAGWVEVTLGGEVAFDTGTDAVVVGDTVTGATSTASAVITKVVVQSGSWSGNDAAGFLHYTSVTGSGFQNAENLQVSAATKCVSTSAGVANALAVGGVYEFANYNFYGSTGLRAMYAVNAVNRGFSFDGTNFFMITSGMTDDRPNYLKPHKKHLFFSFPLGTTQHSSIGEPFVWSPITGAGEIAVGDEVTGMISLTGDALGIFCRNSRYILNGTSDLDWNLVAHSLTAGSIARTLQDLGLPVYWDDRGLNMFKQTDVFGDFQANAFSFKFQKVIDTRRDLLITSIAVRDKSQYRLYFSDNTIVSITFDNNKLLGATVSEYNVPIRCTCSSEDSDGDEILFGGSDDGWVFQLDKGNNFDGGQIDAWLRPVFVHFESPQHRKRFFKFVLDIEAGSSIDMAFLAEYAFGDNYYPSDYEGDLSNVLGGGGYWDISTWETFYWDAPPIANAFGYLQGVGENISLFIRSVGTYDEPHTIQGVIFHVSDHGVKR